MPESLRWTAVLFVSLCALCPGSRAADAAAAGGAPSSLEGGGRIADSEGRPLSGNYLLSFSLFDAPSGGNKAWSESIYVKAVKGSYHAVLGRLSPMPAEVLASAYRIEVAVPPGTGWSVGPFQPGPAPEPVPVSVEKTPASPELPVPQAAPALQRTVSRLRQELDQARQELEGRRASDGLAGRIYEVKSGDTLQSIAVKIYGNPDRWMDLYQANDDRVQRGGELVPGQRLLVPQDGARR